MEIDYFFIVSNIVYMKKILTNILQILFFEDIGKYLVSYYYWPVPLSWRRQVGRLPGLYPHRTENL